MGSVRTAPLICSAVSETRVGPGEVVRVVHDVGELPAAFRVVSSTAVEWLPASGAVAWSAHLVAVDNGRAGRTIRVGSHL